MKNLKVLIFSTIFGGLLNGAVPLYLYHSFNINPYAFMLLSMPAAFIALITIGKRI